MDFLRDIKKKRKRCLVATIESSQNSTLPEIAKRHGLSKEAAEQFLEVEENTARLVLARLLHMDMAYGSKLMPLEIATELANAFVDRCADAVFFTNGLWDEENTMSSFSYVPATAATFDGGLIAISPGFEGCVWFYDED